MYLNNRFQLPDSYKIHNLETVITSSKIESDLEMVWPIDSNQITQQTKFENVGLSISRENI